MSNLKKLSLSTLKHFHDKGVHYPKYDLDNVGKKWLHIGLGNFHRAHQASVADHYLNIDPSWGIVGSSIKPQTKIPMEQEWDKQDYLFTVTLRKPGEHPYTRVIGSIREFHYYQNRQSEILRNLADPNIKLLTMTVTEKGYCQNQDGHLNFNNPDIQHDLKNIEAPKSILGYIAHGIIKRRQKKIKPYTVLCCDLIPNSGEVLKDLMLTFTEKLDPELKKYIDNEITFPNAMVDRIVPVTQEADKQYLKDKFGMIDDLAVKCEDHLQWVIEDKFCNERPNLNQVGVTFTDQVILYEQMKIRLLNGSHTCLAYFSNLMGISTVDKAIKNEIILNLVKHYMDEVSPTVRNVPDIDIEKYKRTLRSRFGNEAISDSIARIEQNGYKKVRDFVIPSIKERIQKDLPTKYGALVVASWIRYITGKNEKGEAITTIDDPRAEFATPLAQKCLQSEDCDPTEFISKILDHHVAEDKDFIKEVTKYLVSLKTKGAEATLKDALSED